MKVIKAAGIIVILIISAVVLIGIFVPKVDDEFEITIDRSVMQVYAGMANLQQAPDWVVGLDSVKQTGGFLAMPGSTFKLYYSNDGRSSTEYNMEILEMMPLSSVRFRLYNDSFDFDVAITFQADGTATILNTHVQMHGNQFLSRSFLPLIKSTITQIGKDNLLNLKQIQEQ